MKRHRLTRATFHDRPLTPQHLWAAAEIWRGAFPITGFLKFGVYELRTEIWGFARHDAPALRAALAAAAPGCTVDHGEDADPDLLIVRGPWTDLAHPVTLTPWLSPLLSPACAGLFLVHRIRACGAAPQPGRTPAKSNTLALAGTPRDGALLLKACWHVGQTPVMERVYRGTNWEHEAALLRAIDAFLYRFSEHPAAHPGSPEFAAALADAQDAGWYVASAIGSGFQPRRTARVANFIARYVAEFPDDHSPAAFARRCALPLLLILAGIALFRLAPHAPPHLRTLFVALAAAGAYLIGRVAYLKAKRMIRYHRAMNAGLRKLYEHDVRMEIGPIDPAVEADPTCRKLTTELLALGATHCYDFELVRPSNINAAHRLFILPDQPTYISVGLMTRSGTFRQFPALLILHLNTRFEDGLRFATVNSQMGYRKNRMPNSRGRSHPGVDHPADLLARHTEHIRQLIEQGHVPLPVDPAALPALTAVDHQEARAFYAHRTIYTWSDALHEAFKIPRKQKDD